MSDQSIVALEQWLRRATRNELQHEVMQLHRVKHARQNWTATRIQEIRNAALEEAAVLAQHFFVGMFTGWIGYSSAHLITLDEAEDVASECGPICAEAIRDLKSEKRP